MQKNDDLLRERRKDEHVALGVKQNEQLAPSSLKRYSVDWDIYPAL